MSYSELRTGDIVLFEEDAKCGSIFKLVDWAIRCWTMSPYSHAGLVVVDPVRVNICSGKPVLDAQGQPMVLKGTYIWDSSKHFQKDPMDGKIKFGIALVPVETYMHDKMLNHQTLYKRTPVNPDTYRLFTPEIMSKLYTKVYDKPYDTQLGHWLAGMFHILIPRSSKAFFCSAFVSYALTYVGVLRKDTCYTIKSPADLSSKADHTLSFTPGHEYGEDTVFSSF